MLGKSKSRSEDRDQTSQQIVLSLDSLSYRTGSGTSHPVVKERALLSCRKANRQSLTIAIPLSLVNTRISHCGVIEPASHPASTEQTLYFLRPAFLFISRGAQAPFPIRKRLSSSPVKCPPSTPVNQGCPSSPTGRLLWKETYDVPWQGVENPPQVLRGASSSAAAISSRIAMPSWTALPSCFRTRRRGSRPRLWDPSGMFSAKS